VAFVVAGVILGAIGVYKPLVDLAGAGATVPLTGFGYLISKGVREAVDSSGAIGIISGGLSASSIGITTALMLGLLISVFLRGKPKKM
jgi:stage V sporulation protein AE